MQTSPSIQISGLPFDGPFSSADALRDAPGVYAILDTRSTGTHVIDVGESEAVRTRVANHDRSDCWSRHRQGRLGVAVRYTSGPAAGRRALEQRVREEYGPPCGDR